MADTSHHAAPVEGDGISYSGLVWFMVVILITTIGCQLLMWVLLKAFQHQASASMVPTAPLAATVPLTERPAPAGRVYPDMHAVGLKNGPQPQLLVNEPANLSDLHRHEQEMLTTYGWMDQNAGIVRLPIERAKELILERGLPVRGTDAGKDVKAVKEVKK